MPALRGKPAMELYRPPTMRSPGFAAACPPVNGYGHPHAGVLSAGPAGPGGPLGGGAGSPVRTNSGTALNINAKEFQPGLLDDTCNNNNNNNNNNARAPGAAGSPAKQPPALMRSKSSKDARSLKGKADIPANLMRSRSSKDGKLFQKVTFRSGGGGDAPAPSDDATNYDEKRPARGAPPAAAAGSGGAGVVMPPPPPLPGLQRSKSMVCGTADMVRGGGGVGPQHQLQECSAPIATGAGAELGHFSPDVQLLIAIAVEDPNRLSGRHMMELVRHVFTRLVEAARYGEPAARLCIAVIERERTETFLETLLNTCQEWYQQRDRLLRPHQSTFGNGFVPASPRWIAYITFLNELFALLKRRQMSRPRMAGTATQMLLELLAECCLVTLRAPSVNSLAETECVFLILTSIGRDLEQDAAPQLERIMAAVRDALINCSLIGTVSKTLLQLVELQAARWQLPAPTVMYYYPMTAK